MKKHLVAALLVATLFSPSATSAAGLTMAQIDAILSLLASFGADQTVVNRTAAALGRTPTPTSLTCAMPTRDLKYGSTDAATGGQVTVLQRYLATHGYLATAPTGYFGSLTQQAVTALQRARAISPVSGYVGPLTRATMVCTSASASASPPPVTTPPTTPPSPAGAPTATLTANGKTEITINAGDAVTYAWSSHNGASAKGSFTTASPACGVGSGPIAWDLANTLSGSELIRPGSCAADNIYTFVYTVTGTNGDTVSAKLVVHVNPLTLTVQPCVSTPGAVCATYPGAPKEVWLMNGTLKAVNTSYPLDVAKMGVFTIDGAPHELWYVYGSITSPDFNGGLTDSAGIFVVDVTAGKEVAAVSSRGQYFNAYHTYFSYLTDPQGNKYPFVGPGAHYFDPSSDLAAARYATWDYLCVFSVAAIVSPVDGCNIGFAKYSATFTTPEGKTAAEASGFRHNGGWVEDVDRDGWGDINLPFLKYILTISGRTGARLGLAHFDVAAADEPTAPPYFHAGRLYGGFRAFTDPQTGTRNVLFSDGVAVGGTDYWFNCNVSSYMAVGQWSGTTLNLKWSDYLSFSKTLFNPPYDSTTNYSRLGDDLNNCANWIGNDIAYVNNRAYAIYDRFSRTTSTPVCQQEILNEQKANFTTASTNATNACFTNKALPLTGRWSTRVLDLTTGKEASSLANSYAWGSAPNVLPGASPTYLVQEFVDNGGIVAYKDTATMVGARLAIAKLDSSGTLVVLARSAIYPATPIVLGNDDQAYGASKPGEGSSFLGIPELVYKDVDGDGLNDIQLANGKWLGYSVSTGGLISK